MTKRLTLSLDNGPDLEHTPRVLDILARRSIRAAFFMVGERLATPGAREVARRVAEAGHRVGNHTMTHGRPLGLRDDDEAIAEIARAGDVLAEFLGDPPLFAPTPAAKLGRTCSQRRRSTTSSRTDTPRSRGTVFRATGKPPTARGPRGVSG